MTITSHSSKDIPAREPPGRTVQGLRPVQFEIGVNRYAEGSVLVKMGHTHVLCTCSVEESVPGWLKGKGQGWLTAEYSMLPRATHTRTRRDREKISGRTQEIQRLIGRALRACVNLDRLGERTLLIDCDVLQADGGTRTASINGACLAVGLALKKLEANGKIVPRVFLDTVAAVSIGIRNDFVLTDLDYQEDSNCAVDMNFVITGSGNFIEVQGTAEKGSFTKIQMDSMSQAALEATRDIHLKQAQVLADPIIKN